MAGKAFSNANYPDERNGYQFFKAIVPLEIHTGESFLYSYISFTPENSPKYVFKAGNISTDEVKAQTGDGNLNISWKENENKKIITVEKDIISDIWDHNVLCYFGPDRYEKPVWMGNKYYRMEDFLHPTVRNRFDGQLKNPIEVKNVTSLNLQWILDVIADSRADIEGDLESMKLAHTINANDMFLLKLAKYNLETILSKILGEDIYFQLLYRDNGGSRFRIAKKSDDSIVCPTLDSLSAGQIALFYMFATIVRYADNNNINQSIHLDNITGIVVIDEIELHLHSKLQKEVLPELIKLFPKIQFVISSHSPLFLLGMKDTFGEDSFDIFELPSCMRIGTEKFAEFQNAYSYLKKTDTYQQEVFTALRAVQPRKKAIVVTEGSTDWKHMNAAFERLQSDGLHAGLASDLDFEFFKFEPEDYQLKAEHKLKMGNSVLCSLCENMAKLPQPVKYIFIADRDDECTNKKLSGIDSRFKSWGNNVYSFILPVPTHRLETPSICIEHYYSDDEIKTEWIDPDTGVAHRLFMGNEFDERGIASNLDRYCEKRSKCGSLSISIIEGSSGERVTSISNNNGTNYALPKSQFAKLIMDRQAPFNAFGVESFVSIFEIIKDIIRDNQEVTNA